MGFCCLCGGSKKIQRHVLQQLASLALLASPRGLDFTPRVYRSVRSFLPSFVRARARSDAPGLGGLQGHSPPDPRAAQYFPSLDLEQQKAMHMTTQPRMAQATEPTKTHQLQPHMFATFVQPLSREAPNSSHAKSWALERPLSIPMKTPMAQIPAEIWRDLRKWAHPAAPPLPGRCAASAKMLKKPKPQKQATRPLVLWTKSQ